MKRYDTLSDLSDSCYYSLVDSNDDSNINDGNTPDFSDTTCIFCDEKFSQNTWREMWVKRVMCQM